MSGKIKVRHGEPTVACVEPPVRIVLDGDREPVRLPRQPPVVAARDMGDGQVAEDVGLREVAHVPAAEDVADVGRVDRREAVEEEFLFLGFEILRTRLALLEARAHLVPFVVAPQGAVVFVRDDPLVRPEDVDVLHADVAVRALGEDGLAGRADGDVAEGRVPDAADDKRIVADVEPGVVHAQVPAADREAVRAHHRGKKLHVAQDGALVPRQQIECARVDELDALDRDVRRLDDDDAAQGIQDLVVAEDVAHRVEDHAASVQPHARMADFQPRVQDTPGREVNLLHVLGDLQNAIRAGRVNPALDAQDARRAGRGNVPGLLRRVGEDGKYRLVVVVELDAEAGRLGQRDGDDALAERMLQALPRREDLVAADVLLYGDVHRDGTARERELAEPAVHVAAARPPFEDGFLAVVPDDEPFRLLPLADAHPVGVVALDRRRIVGIAHERVRRRDRIFRGE